MGSTISQYKILDKLGEGGTGVVAVLSEQQVADFMGHHVPENDGPGLLETRADTTVIGQILDTGEEKADVAAR